MKINYINKKKPSNQNQLLGFFLFICERHSDCLH